jgi:nicotinamide phosphoribosyltransferase
MYPKDTEFVYSYFESRKGAKYNKTVFFGLQYYIKEYLSGPVVTREKIEEAAEVVKNHLGSEKYFNRAMWEYILEQHHGYLPIEIRAVAEGTPVDVSNVLMTIVNTDPKCFALTNHLETILSQIWASCTVATLSYEVYNLIKYYRDATGSMDGIKYCLHDFGFRGTSSYEFAGIGGCAHLLNFMGTDTINAMLVARDYYNAPLQNLAHSVPASEHSVMTARGKEGEEQVFADLLNNYPDGILSIVIDSYNYKDFMNIIARKYKDKILARNGKVVFRPDSGDPCSVTLEVFDALSDIFGTTKNEKGYKLLHPKVGVIWGDGIEYDGIRSILFTLRSNNYSTDGICFGMGGGLLQRINRDVNRFAFKSSAQCRSGEWHDIFKNPLDASKSSKKGILKLIKNEQGKFETLKRDYLTRDIVDEDDYLKPVFSNGVPLTDFSLGDCRENTGNW